MTIYDIASTVNAQNYQIECARTVLGQVQDYFVHRDEWEYLPSYAKTIDTLLCVINTILHDISPELKQSADELMTYDSILKKLNNGR